MPTTRKRGTGSRGQGKAGGGLVARRKDYDEMKGKPDFDMHRPGSQNPRKGGPGA